MRERLGDLFDPAGKCAHVFTAVFQCYGKTAEGSNVICLMDIRLGQNALTDHLWIHRSKQMKQLELEFGDWIAFSAVVGKYPRQGESFSRGEDAVYDYSLEHIREMRIIRKGKKESE